MADQFDPQVIWQTPPAELPLGATYGSSCDRVPTPPPTYSPLGPGPLWSPGTPLGPAVAPPMAPAGSPFPPPPVGPPKCGA